ncbi:MAG: ABC transporter ATP-binding protein [Polaribacter sp.]|nr:ABC transporter ATP-binding protein [Polaribacter sp.]MDC1374904.1 ABC transporter ATP-binding protein [Polaribacter sp.]MDG1245357.1 ABC transporter ATP-binding protein [Polaribacter sp.]MDG1320903.1 ABC transporter ATP-binding protein [Polaribacter sp.]
MKTDENNILSTENLTIGYEQKKQQKIIAKGINFAIRKGTLNAVIGKNGIGKSTLLRTLSKVQKPLAGVIFINKKDSKTYQYQELATTISLVLTERLPESQLTVFELIALGRQPYTNWIDSLTKKDLKKIHWAMEQTNLEGLQNNRCSELSDGQMQRVLIARALSQDTEIIILDEPTAHLDMHHTIAIFELLKKLTNSTKKTIIISTHEINLATKMCDELIVLSENIIYTGTTAELIQQNAFENLFASKIVKFDRTLQQYVINSQSF